MASLGFVGNTLHVSVGLLTSAYIKNSSDEIKNINANPNLSMEEKENAIEKIKNSQKKASLAAYVVDRSIDASLGLANYYLTDIGRKSGDSNYQAEIDRNLNQVSWAVSTGLSTVSSISAGFALGGIAGASIMGVVSLSSNIINKSLEISKQNRSYQWQLFEDEQRVEVLRQRAGMADYNGRKR